MLLLIEREGLQPCLRSLCKYPDRLDEGWGYPESVLKRMGYIEARSKYYRIEKDGVFGFIEGQWIDELGSVGTRTSRREGDLGPARKAAEGRSGFDSRT